MNKEEPRSVEQDQVEQSDPEQEALWDEILAKIAPPTDPSEDNLWQSAVQEIPQTEIRQRRDAQRFQGQGQ